MYMYIYIIKYNLRHPPWFPKCPPSKPYLVNKSIYNIIKSHHQCIYLDNIII